MNLICKWRGHTTEYQFALQRHRVTVSGDAPSAAVVHAAMLCESATPVREVCTRCDVITWEGPRPSDAPRASQTPLPVSPPQGGPVRPSAANSDGVLVGAEARQEPQPLKTCPMYVLRNRRREECGAVLLRSGGCANRHHHEVF